jgi:hypothetical protein
MVKERSWHLGALLLVASLLAPGPACSQQSGDIVTAQDPASANPPTQTQTPGTDSSASQSEPNPAGANQGLFARALNSASPLGGQNGPLQWGWVSIRSIGYLQYFTDVTLEDPGAQPLNEDITASQISTTIVLNHAFGASRQTQFTVQYAPSLFISEGHVYTNALNQTAGLDMTFQLNPRLKVQVTDRFSYFGSQRYFSGLSLNADYSLGTLAQNSFLNGPGSVLYNTVGAAFSYLWSPRTTITITPTFGYQTATGAVSSAQTLTAFYEGGQVSVTHGLSATQQIGLSYMGEYASYSNTSTTAGPQQNGLLQDFRGTYSQQIGESWRVNLGFGFTGNSEGFAQTALAGSVGVTKSLHRMDFAFDYNRGHQFNGYITSASTDRVDLVHTIRWSRRFWNSTSAAYFRTAGGSGPAASGWYGTEQLNFGLTRSLSLTGGLSYTKQTGDGVFVQNGHSRIATVGVTWNPTGAATTQVQP